MSDISAETFVINNPDGSISLDPYHGKTREELKDHCRELVRAIGDWQMIAMHLHKYGRPSLSQDDQDRLDRLIEAYRD